MVPQSASSIKHSVASEVDHWRLRSDLAFHWIEVPGDCEGYWVVRDPFCKDRFCLNRSEKQLLELADGQRSVAELGQLAAQRFGDFENELGVFLRFFSQARQKGLLFRCIAEGPIDQLIEEQTTRPKSSRWLQVLSKLIAIRLPGIHPESIAFRTGGTSKPNKSKPDNRTSFPTSNAVTPKTLIMLGAMVIFSIALLVRNFETFSSEVSQAMARREVSWFVALMVSIAAAKTIHELAHVVVCRWVGAECRELGVMLLFGTPCLYCDVTDVWSVPERWKRLLVSAAGMIAEVALAAIATFVWAVTNPSLVHDLSLVLMMVCTVSTVAINANPLLRYDGYYLLCDWIGTANLSGEANETLRQYVRRGFWGLDESLVPIRSVGRSLPRWMLVIYAIASHAYRLMILVFISGILYKMLLGWSLGLLGTVIAVTLVGATVLRALKTVLQPPENRSRETNSQRLWMTRPRVLSMLTLGAIILAAILIVPLPCSERVPALFVTGDRQELHAAEPGKIQWISATGTVVRTGDVLMKIANDRLVDNVMQARASAGYWNATLQAWESRRGADSANSTSLAIARGRLESARNELQEAQQRLDSTTVFAPRNGVFIHHPYDDNDLVDPGFQIGKSVQAGERLGSVGNPGTRESLAIANQRQVDAIRVGQSVRLRHASLATDPLRGRVEYVERLKWRAIPDELVSIANLNENPSESLSSQYLVRVRWLKPPEGSLLAPQPMPRSVGTAEIAVDPRSLWDRFFRLLTAEYAGL